MTPDWTHWTDTELPSWAIAWTDNGTLVNYASGWTLAARVVTFGGIIVRTVAAVGYATSPNVIATPSAADIAAIGAGLYRVLFTATRTSDGLTRVFRPSRPPTLQVHTAPAVAA